MEKLLFNIKVVLLSFIIVICLFGSCTEEEMGADCEECVECEENQITITEDINWLYYGAYSFLNESYFEFRRVVYYKEKETDEYTLLLRNQTWYQNTTWALRNQIRIHNFNPVEGDVIPLVFQPVDNISNTPTAYFDTALEDGTVWSECYEILETADFPSWVTITDRDDDKGQITGNLQVAFTISGGCSPKDNPDDPDEIFIHTCYFVAKLIGE